MMRPCQGLVKTSNEYFIREPRGFVKENSGLTARSGILSEKIY